MPLQYKPKTELPQVLFFQSRIPSGPFHHRIRPALALYFPYIRSLCPLCFSITVRILQINTKTQQRKSRYGKFFISKPVMAVRMACHYQHPANRQKCRSGQKENHYRILKHYTARNDSKSKYGIYPPPDKNRMKNGHLKNTLIFFMTASKRPYASP